MRQHSPFGLLLALAAAGLMLVGCGGTSGTTPSASFPIGGTTATGTTTASGTTPTTGTPASTTPAVALNVTAGSGNGCITLAWTASNLTQATFDVLRVSGGTTATVASGLTGMRYVDVGLAEGTAYQYQIVAHGTGSVTTTSNTGATTAFGATASGFGDPPSVAAGPDLLFTGGAFLLTTSASSTAASANYFTVTLTLSHAALASDLQSVQYQGALYDEGGTLGFAKGVSVSGNQVSFDSRAAGIVLDAQYRPVAQAGYYSVTATVDGTAIELTAPAGFAGSQPNTSTFTDASGRVFSMTINNNL